MLRTVISIGIRRRPLVAMTATASTFGLVTLLSNPKYSSTAVAEGRLHTETGETGDDPSCCIQPMPMDNFSNHFSKAADLTLPTVQASARALNLVGTAMLMVSDYQYAKLERIVFARLDAQSIFPLSIFGPSAEEAEMIQLENRVERCKKNLEKAQSEYTGKGDEVASTRQAPRTDLREQVHHAASGLAKAEEELAKHGGNRAGQVHRKAAGRLLRLCSENGGVYIKVGQHLANLDYLVPQEYIETLSSLFDDAPVTSYDDVREVIREDLGLYPEDVFESFESEPIASASLAQVHIAYQKGTGKKLAVKVQHRGLRETSKGDIFALESVVGIIESLFSAEFKYGWIMEEIAPQLPRELDFKNEGKNSEIAANHIGMAGINCIVPVVHWNETRERVLTMDFEEGFRVTDVDAIKRAGLKHRDVARLVSSVFNSQIFQSGRIHCDPHPANVLLREKNGKPQLVLVDHGLYKQIDDDFRLTYATLWKSLMMADITAIKTSCNKLGIGDMYPLLAAMLTSRPFDEIIERSKTGSLENGRNDAGDASDKAMIRGYAQKFIVEIIDMLDSVPRQMLLLFKMNDCLRHIDYALGSPSNTLVAAGGAAAKAVYEAEMGKAASQSIFQRIKSVFSYYRLLARIHAYEWVRCYPNAFRQQKIML